MPDATRLSALTDLVATFLPRLVAAVAVLAAFWLLLRVTLPLLRRLLGRARLVPALREMLVDGLYKGSVLVIAVITGTARSRSGTTSSPRDATARSRKSRCVPLGSEPWTTPSS